MDISIKEALEALRPVAIQARAAIRLNDVLGSLVGIENHRDELTKEVDGLKGKIAQAKATCEAAILDGTRAREQAQKDSEAMVKEAKDRAAVIADECKRSVTDTAKQIEEDQVEANILLARITASRAALATEVDELTNQRDALVKEVAALKDRFKTLVE